MGQARGYKSHFLLDFEETFGQNPEAPAAILIPFQGNFGLKSTQNLLEDQTIRNMRDPAMPSRGNIDVSGQVTVPVDEIAIGYILKAIFGDPETSGVGDPYTHVFKPADVQPSLVIERGFNDIGQYLLYNGCKISKLSIPIGGEGDLVATIDIMGAKETVGEASYDAASTTIVLTKFNQFQAAIKEGGASIAIVTQGNIDIDLGLDGDTYVIGGQGFRGSINEGLIQISGSLTAFFQDDALLNKAIDGTESSLEITWTNGNHSLGFLLPEVLYERNSPAVDGPKGVMIELPYRAYFKSNANNTAIIATLKNGQASYATE